MFIKLFFLIAGLVFFTSCQLDRQSASANSPDSAYFKAVPVTDPELDELSGIAASRKFADVLWVHNDSGDKARIFAINTKGQTIGQVLLAGVQAIDWEDIAAGPGPQQDINYIYIADIGDNKARRATKIIYRLPEPDIDKLKKEHNLTVSDFATIRFRLPDGARDSEALMCDPLNKDLYIVSKRENRVHLYVLPYPQDTTQILTARFLHDLPLTQITAGDIAPSGRHIMLKNYLQIFYFPRGKGQTVAQALDRFPSFLPYKGEPQGEALCFAPDESGYYTISESIHHQPCTLYFYTHTFTKP
ncbi:hypothetical protein DRI50_11960 [candidate division KSB1 bacterium]|nr:MAG: hypothetical protein DRI50_11960 [candidate division KSB1 bacterium]